METPPVQILETMKAEDWENACHELFWETGNVAQFEIIQRLAMKNAEERAEQSNADQGKLDL